MFKIALRNIWRNKRRTLLTGSSIAAAVMIVIYVWSFISGVIEFSFDNFIRIQSGHLRILNINYLRREKMFPLEANIADYSAIQKMIEENPQVTTTAGRIKFGVLLEKQGEEKPVMGVGIDPQKEEAISHLSQYLVAGKKIETGEKQTNVGEILAKELGLKVGDTLTVVTQTAYGSMAAMNLKVVGIFRYGVPSYDGRIFYLPLDKAQELLDLSGRVTEIFVLLKDKDQAPAVAREINGLFKEKKLENYTAVPWQDQGIVYFWMRMAKSVYGFICFLILLLASFAILNTMFMSVLERTREIGMLKALGMKNRQIIWLILFEALVMGIGASFVGALFGSVISFYLSTQGIDLSAIFEKMRGTFNFPVSYVYRGIFSWANVFWGFVFGVFFSVLAALPPAWAAAKMEPEKAMRTI